MEEEISLRELIETLIKGKWIITIITIVALLISGVASFIFMEPTYEAKATMMVNQSDEENSLTAYLRSISGSDFMSLETYTNQIKNPVLLERVRERLQLNPEKYTIRKLSELFEVKSIDKTNLIELGVTGTDPKLAADLVNGLAGEFVQFINEEGKKQLTKTIGILREQMLAEEVKMNTALDEYTAFLAQSQGVAQLESLYNAKLSLLTSKQIDLTETKISLETTKAGLKEGEQVLAKLSPLIGTEKTLLEDDVLREYLKGEMGGDLSKLVGIKLTSQDINDAYITLLASVNSAKVTVTELEEKIINIKTTIAETAQEVEQLQIELAEKKAVDERLRTDLNRAKSNFERFNAKHEEALIASTLDTTDTQIKLVAPAWTPVTPVGPRKMLNLAIAGVLGLMLGVFTAFFRDYWTSTAPGAKNMQQ
ncbi:MAG: Wzz/FepE/Etk N-terminal domain-containing protein [Bacillota bacterium]